MNSFKVSVIVPCYNQARYLGEALQSVLNQTHSNWECIIVNDGSTDNTTEVAQKWVNLDSRFVLTEKENGGLSSARNAGLDISSGDYIQFLDSDDVLDTIKFELSLQELNAAGKNNVKVAVSNFSMFDSNPAVTSKPYCDLNNQLFHFQSLLYQWEESFTIPIHCGLFNSSLFYSFRFPENLKSKEDWVMWVSLFHSDCKSVFIDKALAFYRRNPDSMTMTKNMLPDFIAACTYFKDYLTENEYNNFCLILISRYYKLSKENSFRLREIKKSTTYQAGLVIKKIFRFLGVLNIAKRIFPLFLKLKAK